MFSSVLYLQAPFRSQMRHFTKIIDKIKSLLNAIFLPGTGHGTAHLGSWTTTKCYKCVSGSMDNSNRSVFDKTEHKLAIPQSCLF